MLQTQDLNMILDVYNDLLLVSKTASGKTSLVFKYFSDFPDSLIFLSPLKSINLEVEHRAINTFGEHFVFAPKSIEDHEKVIKKIKGQVKSFIILSAEKIPDGFFDEVFKYDQKVLVVLDEVHLFWHWGENFRPLLWDKYCEIKNTRLPLLMLTATLNDQLKENFANEISFCDRSKLILAVNNYSFKKNPFKINSFSKKQKGIMYRRLLKVIKEKESNETILVFLPYRKQVIEWSERFSKRKLALLTCMSGEVERFKESLINLKAEGKNPDIIFSTITLSHGVNLPCIANIFIFYEIQHRDFWIQMVGRGGRQGEKFSVYEMNGFDQLGLPRGKIFLKGQYYKNLFLDYIFRYI